MRIRQFRPDDQGAARSVVLAGFRDRFGWINPELNHDLDDIVASYIALGHRFLIVEEGERIVGTGALLLAASRPEIVRVSVLRCFRRRGIATAVTAVLVDAAADAGANRVVVATSFPDALALYEKCGFERVGRDGHDTVLERTLDQTEPPPIYGASGGTIH